MTTVLIVILAVFIAFAIAMISMLNDEIANLHRLFMASLHRIAELEDKIHKYEIRTEFN